MKSRTWKVGVKMDRLLFVDDDMEILRLNDAYFTKSGFVVDTASNAMEAFALLKNSRYSCIILDIRMDGQDGFEICRKFREMSNTPIIFLTVLTDESSLEKGFGCGGDDYIAKPYRMKELELRIRARMHPRRPPDSNGAASGGQNDSQLYIAPDEKQAYIGSKSLGLTVNEFQILQFLSQHKGIPYRQEEIYEALWGERYNTHSIQILIMRIRKKLKLLAPDKEYIRTQWGKGYVFTE